ncbi:MAG TPA: DUF4276 family protein [Desulfobulbaceae bacterium]|nr:DUF4276 family protein [Desulfobulbaceae bacterium]
MVRVAISVEGQTEERFVQMSIVPYLQERDIYAMPFLLGRTGGNVSFARIKKDLNRLAGSFDKVTTFYDFYGFRDKDDNDSKTSLEQKIKNCVAGPLRDRIIPYIQMYEFEGLLFSSPDAIASVLEDDELLIWAKDILRQFGGDPERINDSPQTAPSKRFALTPYRKITHGPNIAKEIGIDALRGKCTGFDNWLAILAGLQ